MVGLGDKENIDPEEVNMTPEQAGFIPLASLGMTLEKYTLLEELAETKSYWTTAHTLVKTVANLELTSLSNHQRRRLSSIILELSHQLYRKSWRIDEIKFEVVERPQWQTAGLESPFDKIRRSLSLKGG